MVGIYSCVGGVFCEVGRIRVALGGEVGKEIEVEECKVGICEGVGVTYSFTDSDLVL